MNIPILNNQTTKASEHKSRERGLDNDRYEKVSNVYYLYMIQ